jgi:hypothetical protein
VRPLALGGFYRFSRDISDMPVIANRRGHSRPTITGMIIGYVSPKGEVILITHITGTMSVRIARRARRYAPCRLPGVRGR